MYFKKRKRKRKYLTMSIGVTSVVSSMSIGLVLGLKTHTKKIVKKTLNDITKDQIQAIDGIFPNVKKYPSEIKKVDWNSKIITSHEGVTFNYKKTLGKDSWEFKDLEGSVTYELVAKKGKNSREFKIEYISEFKVKTQDLFDLEQVSKKIDALPKIDREVILDYVEEADGNDGHSTKDSRNRKEDIKFLIKEKLIEKGIKLIEKDIDIKVIIPLDQTIIIGNTNSPFKIKVSKNGKAVDILSDFNVKQRTKTAQADYIKDRIHNNWFEFLLDEDTSTNEKKLSLIKKLIIKTHPELEDSLKWITFISENDIKDENGDNIILGLDVKFKKNAKLRITIGNSVDNEFRNINVKIKQYKSETDMQAEADELLAKFNDVTFKKDAPISPKKNVKDALKNALGDKINKLKFEINYTDILAYGNAHDIKVTVFHKNGKSASKNIKVTIPTTTDFDQKELMDNEKAKYIDITIDKDLDLSNPIKLIQAKLNNKFNSSVAVLTNSILIPTGKAQNVVLKFYVGGPNKNKESTKTIQVTVPTTTQDDNLNLLNKIKNLLKGKVITIDPSEDTSSIEKLRSSIVKTLKADDSIYLLPSEIDKISEVIQDDMWSQDNTQKTLVIRISVDNISTNNIVNLKVIQDKTQRTKEKESIDAISIDDIKANDQIITSNTKLVPDQPTNMKVKIEEYVNGIASVSGWVATISLYNNDIINGKLDYIVTFSKDSYKNKVISVKYDVGSFQKVKTILDEISTIKHGKSGNIAKLPSVAIFEEKYKDFASVTQPTHPKLTINIIDILVTDNDASGKLTYKYKLLASGVYSKEFTFEVTGFKTIAIVNKENEQAKIDKIDQDNIKDNDQIIASSTKLVPGQPTNMKTKIEEYINGLEDVSSWVATINFYNKDIANGELTYKSTLSKDGYTNKVISVTYGVGSFLKVKAILDEISIIKHKKSGNSAKLPSVVKFEEKYKDFASETYPTHPRLTISIVDVLIMDDDASGKLTYKYKLSVSGVKSKEFTFEVTGFKTTVIDLKEKEQAKINKINQDDIKNNDQIIASDAKHPPYTQNTETNIKEKIEEYVSKLGNFSGWVATVSLYIFDWAKGQLTYTVVLSKNGYTSKTIKVGYPPESFLSELVIIKKSKLITEDGIKKIDGIVASKSVLPSSITLGLDTTPLINQTINGVTDLTLTIKGASIKDDSTGTLTYIVIVSRLGIQIIKEIIYNGVFKKSIPSI